MQEQKIINLLKKEMVVAMGCTEPAAAALAGAKAKELLGKLPEKVTVYSSRDMIKNAMGVGIPNCSLHGIQAAVCLGICGGSSKNGLSILSVVTAEQQKTAAEMAKNTTLEMASGVPPVYIRVLVEAGGKVAESTISHEHDCFTSLICDGVQLCNNSTNTEDAKAALECMSFDEISNLSIQVILDFANNVDPDEVQFVLDGANINMALAQHSIDNAYGLLVGKTVLSGMTEKTHSITEAIARGAGLAAAASDARMSGCAEAVVINSGSGNQGITCSVPVLTLAMYLCSSREKTIRALCISQIIALSLTAKKDRLSALCGAFTAAIGAGCGYVYLLDGGEKEMDMTLRTMVANLMGIVCDGAKQTCALKIYSCIEAAGLSCRLALEGKAPSSESGIVGGNSAQTIAHLSKISHEGMLETDKTILEIMLASGHKPQI
ncbi:MAG: L-serine ammonia-lyase, iron-sulfur-dependent, subunit alpha [Hydrogenoanaerobacterium sp.]